MGSKTERDSNLPERLAGINVTKCTIDTPKGPVSARDLDVERAQELAKEKAEDLMKK